MSKTFVDRVEYAEKKIDQSKAAEEQLAYAGVLNRGMWLGLAILVLTFAVYISGVLTPFVPVDDLPKYWGLKVSDFNHTLHAPTGWGWAAMVGRGDYLNFIGIACLAGLTVLCYLVLLPIFSRKRQTVYIVIAILEIAVLVLAASGILKTGGH